MAKDAGSAVDPIEDLLGHRGEPLVPVADRQLAEVGQVLPDILDAGLILPPGLHGLDLAVGLDPVEGQSRLRRTLSRNRGLFAYRATMSSERLVTSAA